MCIVRQTPAGVEPHEAAPGVYLAGHDGEEVIVRGPHKVYPSGLPYYTLLGTSSAHYVFAGELDWIKPVPLAERIMLMTRRVFRTPGPAKAA